MDRFHRIVWFPSRRVLHNRTRHSFESAGRDGGAGTRAADVSLPARGRPPQAAAPRADLEVVENLLTNM
jgi:hypothetical protein